MFFTDLKMSLPAKIIKVFIILLLFSSCKKAEIVNDRAVSFTSYSANVFGKLSDARLIYPNTTYRLNLNEIIVFERNYVGANHFNVSVSVDGVIHSLNNQYVFEVK